MQKKSSFSVQKMTFTAVFCALAFIVSLLPMPKVMFLTFDIKDTLIIMAGMLFGPSAALSISVAIPLLEMITTSATGPWGMLMNFLSSCSFAFVGSLIYKKKKTLSGAIIGLFTAVLSQVAVMILANLLITPIYMGVSRETVLGLLLPLFVPFNLTKAVLNASLAMMLYKPISNILKRAHILSGIPNFKFTKRSMLIFFSSLTLVAVATVVLFVALNATFA